MKPQFRTSTCSGHHTRRQRMAGRELAWKAVTYTAVFAAGTVAVQQGLIRVDVKEKGEDASRA